MAVAGRVGGGLDLEGVCGRGGGSIAKGVAAVGVSHLGEQLLTFSVRGENQHCELL